MSKPDPHKLRGAVLAGVEWSQGRTAWWLTSGALDVTVGDPPAVVATCEAPPFFDKATSAVLLAGVDGGLCGLVTFRTDPPLQRTFGPGGDWLGDRPLPKDRACWIAGVTADRRYAVLEGWPDPAQGRRRPRTTWDLERQCTVDLDPGPVQLPARPALCPVAAEPMPVPVTSPTPLSIASDYEPANTYDTADVFDVSVAECDPLRLDWRPTWACRCGPRLALWSEDRGLEVVPTHGDRSRGRGEPLAYPCTVPPTVLAPADLAWFHRTMVCRWHGERGDFLWSRTLDRRVWALQLAELDTPLAELRVADDGGVAGLDLESGAELWRLDTRASGDLPVRLVGDRALGVRGSEWQLPVRSGTSNRSNTEHFSPRRRAGARAALALVVGLAVVGLGLGLWARIEQPKAMGAPLDGSGTAILGCQDFAADHAEGTRAALQQAAQFWRERLGQTRDARAILAATGAAGRWGNVLGVHLLLAAARDPKLAEAVGTPLLRDLTAALAHETDLPLAGQRALAGLALVHPAWFRSPGDALARWQAQLSEPIRQALRPLAGPLPSRLRVEVAPEDRPLVLAWVAAVGSAEDPTASAQLLVRATDRQVERTESVRTTVARRVDGEPQTRLIGGRVQTERPPRTVVEQVQVGSQVVAHPVRWLHLELRDATHPGAPPRWQLDLPDRLLWLGPGAPELSDWSSETRCGGWLWGTEAGWLLGPEPL